jgi:O-antigen/teichoic acid export membrane protein
MSEQVLRRPVVAAAEAEPGTTVARNALFLLAGQVASTALAIVLSAALGRSLGATDFGIYYLITTTATFAYVMAEWGQPFVVIRAAARDPARSGDLLGTALGLRAAFALAVLLPAGVIEWALGYGARTAGLSVLLILATMPLFLAQAYGMVFRAHDKMGREATVSVSNKAAALCLTLPALAIGAGIPGVILAQAIAGLAALAIAFQLYGRLGAPPLRFSTRTARELLAGGTPILVMSGTIAVQPYLDAIILSKLAPAAVVGWFGAAKMIIGTLIAPATILATAAYPRLVRASEDRATLPKEVRAVLRPLLWLGALAGTGTYLFAGTAIALIYGSQAFGPAATILQVFAPGFFLLFIDVLLGHIVYASGRGTGFAAAKIVSVVVGTALNFVLIPYFQHRVGNGGIGVVAAFALSELIVFAGAVMVLRRGTFERGMALDIVRALGAAGATVLLFRILPPLPPWLAIPLCVATFAATSLGLGLMSARDLGVLRALARR